MKAWRVMLDGREVDRVFWNERADGGARITADDVRRSLVEHDGYDAAIEVKAARS